MLPPVGCVLAVANLARRERELIVHYRLENRFFRPPGLTESLFAWVLRVEQAEGRRENEDLVMLSLAGAKSDKGQETQLRVKLDLHVHSCYSFDSSLQPEELREVCALRELDGVAITDHDCLEGALEFQRKLPDLVIVAGEEIRTREGEIIGLFLREEIPPGLSAEETIELIKDQGGVVCIPHPFDYIKLKRLTASRLLKMREMIDCLEVINGKPRYWGANHKASEFSRSWGFLVTAGSDAHRKEDVGKVYTEMESFHSPREFLKNLEGAQVYGERYSAWASQLERWRSRLRRTGKA